VKVAEKIGKRRDFTMITDAFRARLHCSTLLGSHAKRGGGYPEHIEQMSGR
jgi:hypothetical protein